VTFQRHGVLPSAHSQAATPRPPPGIERKPTRWLTADSVSPAQR
jgi:hypothetical protein